MSMITGETQTVGNTLTPQGTTSYVIYYSYPSVANVGTNLTISLTLHVNQFSGYVEYIQDYRLGLQLFVGENSLQETVSGPVGLNRTLYPGATWGPENFTFPLNESATGVAPGTSENATLAVTLGDTVWFGIPWNFFMTEPPMETGAGSLTIENQPATSTTSASTPTRGDTGESLFLYALAASAVVLVVAAVVISRRPRPPAAEVSNAAMRL
jgi:hypothetical protein